MKKKVIVRLCAIALTGMSLFALLGCASTERKGVYFQSTKNAYYSFGRTDMYFWDASKKLNCLEAGILTLPTVIGPIYFWIVRPIYDTVDMALISPLWDMCCMPRDYYLQHNFIFYLKITDEEGKALQGAICKLPGGTKVISDENGIVWAEEMANAETIGAVVDCQGYYSHKEHDRVSMCRIGKKFLEEPKLVRMHRISHQVEKVDVCKQLTNVELRPRGFDCVAGDWVAPAGTGKVAHLYVSAEIAIRKGSERDAYVVFSLPENDESRFSKLIVSESSDGTIGENHYKSWALNDPRKRISSLSGDFSIPFAFRSHQSATTEDCDIYGVIWSYAMMDKNNLTAWFHYSYNKQPGEKSFEWTTPILHMKMPTDASNGNAVKGCSRLNPREDDGKDDGRKNDVMSKHIDINDPTTGTPFLTIFGTDCKVLTEAEAKNIDKKRYAVLEIKMGGDVSPYSKDGRVKYSTGLKGGVERWHYERAPDEGAFWLYLDDDYVRVHKPSCKKFEKGRGRHCKMSDGGQFGECCGGVKGSIEYLEEQNRKFKLRK